MNFEPKHILLFIALILLFTNRVFQKKPFFSRHGNTIRILVFLILIATLVLEFIKTKTYIIFIIAALGIFALAWIFYDMNKKGNQNEEQDSPNNESASDENKVK